MASKGAENAAAVLADMVDLAYFRVDSDRNVVEVSPAMERLTGFQAADVLGRSCLNLHRCDDCLRGCGVFEAGIVDNKRLDLYRADGSTVVVRKSGRVFRGADGAISGALEVVQRIDGEPEIVADTNALVDDPEDVALIRGALERARYRRGEAARLLGMSRTTLWRKMREYGL